MIDAGRAGELLARSPFNVVEIDLPEAPDGGDRYEHAAETLEEWTLQGILSADREPALWALDPGVHGPGRLAAPPGAACSAASASPRTDPGWSGPHERTQPGPKQDRLRLTEATRHNLSPIFSLHEGDAWRHLEGTPAPSPGPRSPTTRAPLHRIWRIGDPAVHRAVTAELADSELLIADGHHRYETALARTRDAIGGEGAHRYTLMALVSLDGPRPDRVPLPPPARRTSTTIPGAGGTRRGAARKLRGRGGPGRAARPGGRGGRRRLRLHRLALPARLPAAPAAQGPAALDAALDGRSDAYRDLDAAILETLVLTRGARHDRRGRRGQARDRLHGDPAEARSHRWTRAPRRPSCCARRRSSRSARSRPRARRCRRSRPTSSPSCSPGSSSTR